MLRTLAIGGLALLVALLVLSRDAWLGGAKSAPLRPEAASPDATPPAAGPAPEDRMAQVAAAPERVAVADAGESARAAAAGTEGGAATGALEVTAARADGSAVAALAIRLSRTDGRDAGTWDAFAATDEAGIARFEALEPGAYRAHCDRNASAAATVRAGETTSVELELKRIVDVEGIVVTGEGRPVPNAEIWLLTTTKSWFGSARIATSDARGEFTARDVPARYSLGARAGDFAPSAPFDLELVSTETSPVSVRLELTEAGGVVIGRVLDPAGTPVPGARVAVGRVDEDSSWRSDQTSEEVWNALTAETDASGRFAIEGVAAGIHPLRARADGFAVTSVDVEVFPGASTARDLVLVPGAWVEGTVTDGTGAPIGGALVLQLDAPFVDPFPSQGPTDRGAPFHRPRVRSDEAGRYRLGPLPPGEVHLYSAKGTTYWDDDVDFAGTAQASLTAASGEVARWDPVLSLGHAIHGRVTYADGTPMSNVFVSAIDESSSERRTEHTRDGSFSITGLELRPYTVSVQLWNAPPGAKLEQRGVMPSDVPLSLVASFDAPAKEAECRVTARLADDAGRLPGGGTIVFAAERTTYYSRHENGTYSAKVAPGIYAALAMHGDSIVGASEPRELRAGETFDFGVVRTAAPGKLTVEIVRGSLDAALYMRLRSERMRMHSPHHAMAPGESAHTFENLLPGPAILDVWGTGVAHASRAVEVRAGETTHVSLQLAAGASRLIAIRGGTLADRQDVAVTIRDAAGATLYQRNHSQHTDADQPLFVELMLPVGRATVDAVTATGLRGRCELHYESLAPSPPATLTLQ